MADIMVDIETVSTLPNAVVLSLAAVSFDPHDPSIEMQGMVWNFDIEEQAAMGRHVDDDTIAWWASQGDEAIELAFGENVERTNILTALDEFHKFVWNSKRIWSQGTVFDIGILENLFRQVNRPSPWGFRQIRDTRTVYDLGIPYEYNNPCRHDPLSDCVAQALAIQEIYEKLRAISSPIL
jgi:hypothetical protein